MNNRWTTRALIASVAALAIAAACTPPPQAGPAGSSSGTRINFPFDWEFRGHEPYATGTTAMVATTDLRATQVGREILQAGGNAVDAAVAVGFALAVVHPAAGNIGGGGFAVVRTAGGETAALDFREMAPLFITPEHFLDNEGVPTNASRVGYLASGVPGTVAGLYDLHVRFGSMPWSELMEPAIDLAETGFTVTERLENGLRAKQGLLSQFPTTAEIFFPGGEPPRTGSIFRQPMLANTLRAISTGGKNAFYRGQIADYIVQDMRQNDGLITREDLQGYEAVWRDPIAFDYRGHTVISMPPPSSGGVTIAQTLNILEGYNLGQMGFNTPESLHLQVEAFRRAFADRNYYMGDPDYVDIPVEQLVSDEYALERRATISRNRASSSEQFNRVPVLHEGSNTTHFSIVDGFGNAVALTYTINSSYGSGVVVDRAGFFLNNELDDFTIRAGYPNQFGLVQSDANLVGSGRRPLSSMTPTIVLNPEGQLLMVTGSPGGAKIITAVAQSIIGVVDYGMDVRTAVDAPRIHHQLLPDEIQLETNGIDGSTYSVLLQMGHRVKQTGTYFADVQLIIRAPDGTLYGASDPRNKDGRALGY